MIKKLRGGLEYNLLHVYISKLKEVRSRLNRNPIDYRLTSIIAYLQPYGFFLKFQTKREQALEYCVGEEIQTTRTPNKVDSEISVAQRKIDREESM